MCLLVTLQSDVDRLPEPTSRKPSAEEKIEGEPAFRTWLQDESFGSEVRTAIWEATPGLTNCIKDGVYEYCLILQGVVEIAEAGGDAHTFRAGDSFILKPGFRGTWRTIETVRKMYVTVR